MKNTSLIGIIFALFILVGIGVTNAQQHGGGGGHPMGGGHYGGGHYGGHGYYGGGYGGGAPFRGAVTVPIGYVGMGYGYGYGNNCGWGSYWHRWGCY